MKIKGILVLLLALGSHVAWAEERGRWKSFLLPTEEEKNRPFFDKNSWVSTTHIGYYSPTDRDNRDIRMAFVNVGAERYLRKNLGFVADAFLTSTEGFIIHSDDGVRLESESFGIGGSLGLKWHFLRGKRWSTFVNGAGGLLLTDKDFPAGGTRRNFMGLVGVGLTIRLREQLHLMASVSHLHVSNGEGLTMANPSFDGRGHHIGLVYRFDKSGVFD